MSACRFMHKNLIPSGDGLSVSSATPGLVGMPAPRAAGAAVAYAAGEHTAARDQAFSIEIDSVAQGCLVGQATFRWKRASAASWEASGVRTSPALLGLADGVKIKWASGTGVDFVLGDAWTIVAAANQGPARLLDGDRDTGWEATGCWAEHLTADLGQTQSVRAAILADHNLSDAATVLLMADPAANWAAPTFWRFVPITRPHLVTFLEHDQRHWRLRINDPANPDGCIKASMFYLGSSFCPARNYSASHGQTIAAGRTVSYGETGRLSGAANYLGRRFDLPFNSLCTADRAGLELMFSDVHDVASGRLRPLFFTPREDRPAETYYCLPEAELTMKTVHQNYWSTQLCLTEVVRTNV